MVGIPQQIERNQVDCECREFLGQHTYFFGYHEGDITFAEADGLGHLFSSSGLHLATFDLETGVPLFDFGYNADNRLVSITDRFGNVTTIERDVIPTTISAG